MTNRLDSRLFMKLPDFSTIPWRLAVWRLAIIFAFGLAAGCAAPPTPVADSLPTASVTPSLPTLTSPPPTATVPPPTETATAIPHTSTPTVTPLPSETPAPTETPTETSPPPTPSGEDAIYVYYILLNDGGPVACGDSLVKANTGLARTGDIEADVRTALERLFFKRQYFGRLYNPVYLSNLEVESVKYDKNTKEVSVRLDGTYVRSGDRCDDGRVRAQIWTTIRQFEGVKTVYILLRESLLGDILATR